MKFKILCQKGDSTQEYDTEFAEVKFNELSKSMIPFEELPNGKMKRVESFRSDIDSLVWIKRLIGG